ncbi:unnamed protein product [Closterium sp. NIES-54]
MYAVTDSAEGDSYLGVPPDPGIEAAALGASASTAPGAGESALSATAPTETLHTFTLDSGASRSFFCDSTTLTPLSRPVVVSLADPSGGLVLAHSSTVLPSPAAPSGLLSGLQLPSFSTNLVSRADLQAAWVDQFTPGGQRVTHCTCSRTGRHLATFTRRPGSSLYTLTTASPPVTASGQVAESGQVFSAASRSSPASAPCSCRPLSHESLLWHHRLGHPSLPRLRGMASRTLVSGLPRSLPLLPPGPAPTCVPCVEGRQRTTPHSPSFPPKEAPLRTLLMDVRGPARVRGQAHERYFLLVVDDFSRYTTIFPLRSKGEVTEVLIDWIRGTRRQLSERFGSDLPVPRLHSDRGGEFSFDLLRAFCRAEGIRQTFTLPASPQQNGIAERHIGMVMDVARTSMIHAAAPHFLWPFAVQYAAHQINLQPRVSLPETTPTLWWTGKVVDASVFCVWGSQAFVRDTSADKLSSRAVPCVFFGFPPNAPGWQFYHPTSRHVLSSQDVTFDESVSYYRLFPYRTASLPPSPLFLAPGAPPVDPLPPQGRAPSGVSQVDPVEPVEVAVDSGAATGAEPMGAGTGGAEPMRVEPGGAESGSAEPGGAELGGAESKGPPGVPLQREPLSPQQLREWYARRCRGAAGAAGAAGGAAGAAGGAAGAGAAGGASRAAGGASGAAGGATGAGAAGGTGAVGGPAGVGAAGGAGAAGPGGARTGGTGAAWAGGAAGVGAAGAGAVATGGASGVGAVGGTGAGGATGVVAGDPRAEGTGAVPDVSGGIARLRPYYVPLLQQVLGLPPSPSPNPPLLSPPPVQSQSQLRPASPQPGPSPYSGPTRGLTERREPKSRPASPKSRSESPVRTVRAGLRVSRPPPVPGTHSMTLRPSTAPRRLPLPSHPVSSLPAGPDPESDSLRAARPTVTRFLATAVTDPLFESIAASALIAELVDFAAAGRLDYASSLVAQSASASVSPPSVGGARALSTDVLEDRQQEFECFAAAVPHLVVKRPPGSPPAFKPRYVARGFSQRQGVDFFQIFSPTPKMTTLRVLLHVAAQRDYKLHSLDFSTAFLQGSLHEEIWLRRPSGFTGSFLAGTQTTLAALGFAPSTADPSLFLRTDTILPPFYVLVAQRTITLTQSHMVQQVLQRFGFTYSSPQSTPLPTGHSLSAPPSDESIEPSGPYPELVGCLMHRKVHWDAAKRLLRYLCSTSGMGLVLGGRARVVLTGHADASWELRWLTYLLTDLGVAPRSPPVLYVDNKAMLALCQEHRLEHRLEHRTKHIALCYFLARELQQCGQLRLTYVASQANTADVFTKAFQFCDHQCFCTVLGLVPTMPRLLTS